MNILFLTIARLSSLEDRGIYNDLMRRFRDEGHAVFVASASERRFQEGTTVRRERGAHLLKIRTFNLQKTNLLEKAVATLCLEYQFLFAVNRHYGRQRFDLILYTTPPITFTSVVRKVKSRDNAVTYLLLKDIFPQNAVDLGMIKENSLIHWMFRRKERALYRASDFIGCMSPANVEYIRRHNPQVAPDRVEENPNSIELQIVERDESTRFTCRKKYGLPATATVFVYGGNLGKPQGIDFLIETIESSMDNPAAFFLVVGSGTEYGRIHRWFQEKVPDNALLLESLPRAEYETLVQACDVGLIFLDRRFTIPNYPSRLLSYLNNSMPILAATDPNSDIGKLAAENGYGLWALAGDDQTMQRHIRYLCQSPRRIAEMGAKGNKFLREHYTVTRSYDIIMRRLAVYSHA